MSAFDIYLVMQLDSIKIHVLSLFMLCLVLYVVFGLIGSLLKDQYITDHHPQDDRARKIQLIQNGQKIHVLLIKYLPVLPLLLLLNAMIPSSKTVAAMYVIPALANNEALKIESKELYELAKGALKDMVKEDAK